MITGTCEAKDCTSRKTYQLYCGKHYQQVKNHGQINDNTIYAKRSAVIEGDIAKIPLGIGAKHGYAIVDKDFAWLDRYNWTIKKHDRVSYAVRNSGKNKPIIKMQWMILPKKDGVIIDHKNGNGLDNRMGNLRYATRQQNQFNLPRNSKNTSGYIGVTFIKDVSKWTVRIRHQGKYITLGRFKDALESSQARETWIIKNRGEFARLGQ